MADIFTAADLLYKDYKKTARSDKDNPRKRGGKDHEYLNRTEEYEMLYFINNYMDAHNYTLKKTGQKIEAYLRQSNAGAQTHGAWAKEIDKALTF